MNRKGFHGVHLVTELALLMVTLLLAIVIFIALKDIFQSSEERAECASQIRVHASAVRLTSGLKAPPIVCPTQRVVATEDDDPRQKIADAMVSCWDTWGRGQYQLFGSEEGTYCHICAIVDKPQEVTGLVQYLATMEVPKQKFFGEKITYMDYLTSVEKIEGTNALGDYRPEPVDGGTYPADKPVAVIFYYSKGLKYQEQLFNEYVTPEKTMLAGATAAGLGVGYVAFGVASIATGPFGIAAFTAYSAATAVTVLSVWAGGAIGTWLGFTSRFTPDYTAMVVARPLESGEISALGCTYAPVGSPA